VEVLIEARHIPIEQLSHAVVVFRRDDQARMVGLPDPLCDLRFNVRRQVGLFLACERKHNPRRESTARRGGIRAMLSGDLDLRPLAPQVDTGRCFDDVHDECSADARRGFQEIQLAVAVAVGSVASVGSREPKAMGPDRVTLHLAPTVAVTVRVALSVAAKAAADRGELTRSPDEVPAFTPYFVSREADCARQEAMPPS